jgi:beta-N-acetylhexosaminidase
MKKMGYLLVMLLPILVAFIGAEHTNLLRPVDRDLPLFLRDSPQWAIEKLESMTLREKIAQSFMVAAYPNKGEAHFQELDGYIQHNKIGGLIYFQGDRENLTQHIERAQKGAKIPLLMAMDAEWGSAMRLFNEPRFPYALTMGAANHPDHTQLIAQAMGQELRTLGIHLNFAPVVDINSNPNNPVIGFRSFGEDAHRVGLQGRAFILGLESQRVLSCMKHFPGHGDTDLDSHYDLPTINRSIREMDIVDWSPFKVGRLAGASSVMMAHLNVPALDSSGTPASLSKVIIQDYLIDRLKFSGLIITDALNMKAVSDRYGKVEVVKMAYLAGNDILLYPEVVAEAIDAIEEAVLRGEISIEEVNRRALKILRAKYHTIIKKSNHTPINAFELENALNRTYEQALTVLKNDEAIPIGRLNQNMACVSLGSKTDAFNKMANEYANLDTFHAFTGAEALRRFAETLKAYDVIVVNVHAKSMLPRNEFGYPSGWTEFIEQLPPHAKVLVTLLGNPYVFSEKELPARADAIILGYENHELAQKWVAQLLFGGIEGTGKLPVTLAAHLEMDMGIATPPASRLKYTQPEELGISRLKLAEIDSLALSGIRAGAYPGCQIVAAKDGKVFYRKSFGFLMNDSSAVVDNETVYDIASVTKIAASTIALMRLDDENRFSLDSTLAAYLPELTNGTPYAKTNLREMMTHQAGFSPWIPFYTKTLDSKGLRADIYSVTKENGLDWKVADGIYILNSYEDSMIQRILETPLKVKKYKYSDLGYYFTKRIIENESDLSLNDYVNASFYYPMGLRSMRYNPLNHYEMDRIAPSEEDTYFRMQTVRGYVHDMGAAMQGGVGGHAGLFTNATDLAALMQMLLNNGVYGGERYLSAEVINKYTACQLCPGNRRGAGFDKPVRSLDGGPTCNRVSLLSFGHTGFTGTQVWADPKYGINYVFLSNRTYPNSENWKLVKMGIRTEIQRVIYEAILDARQ